MPTICKITLDASEYRRELERVVQESRAAAAEMNSLKVDQPAGLPQSNKAAMGAARPEVPENARFMEENGFQTPPCNPAWRKRPLTFLLHCAGYDYLCPKLEQKFLQENFMPIRETGEGLLIQQLCPDPPLHQTCSGP